MNVETNEVHAEAARRVLRDLNLVEAPRPRRLVSGHRSSLPFVADGANGRTYLLKFYLPPEPGTVLPAGVRPDDYARREAGFYRLLDSIDPGRRDFPAPKTIAFGPGDPPPPGPPRGCHVRRRACSSRRRSIACRSVRIASSTHGTDHPPPARLIRLRGDL